MTASVTGPVPGHRALEAVPAPPGGPWRDELGTGQLTMTWSRAMAAFRHAQRLTRQSQELAASAHALIQARAQRRHALMNGQAAQSRQDLLQHSEYLRLLARLHTMPVIEQAKGILMAQSRCSEAEAFDLLRRTSQRSNVPVRELAAQIVATAVQAAPAPRKAG